MRAFPWQRPETMMLRFRRLQPNPERYRIYFRRQGCGLTDQDSIGPKIGRGSSSSQHQRPRIRNRPLTCGFFKMAPYVELVRLRPCASMAEARVNPLRSQTLRMLLTHRQLLQSKAIAHPERPAI